MADYHEMRMIGGRVRPVYFDGEREYIVIDGERSYLQQQTGVSEREAFEYAAANQGYTGTWEEWQAMDADTRRQYELGAAGIPTE
jgi:hypothetical protein